MDQIRLPNALETLSVVFRQILKKEGFSNFGVQVITLIAGSIENSDQVFSDLVASIDQIVGSHAHNLVLRHKTLQLALSIVSIINQGSINAYFLRRDLFNTLASLIAGPETVSLAFDSVLLLGLLANFRRFETRNPYLVRMEDYVDEKAMERIVALTVLALEDLRAAYADVKVDSSASFVGQVTSTFFSVLTSPRSNRLAARPASHAFASQPGRPVCILLPLYDLLNANATFANVLVASNELWAALLSFASYLLCHASANPRTETYGRLVLVLLTALAEQDGRALCGQDGRNIVVAFCRQRLPPLGPSSDQPRPPIAAMLDCAVLYLRHNLQRTLNIEAHAVCLRFVHQLLFCLQSNRARLAGYEWRELWRALLALGSRLGGRAEGKEADGADRLAQHILDVLSFAVIWADNLFESNSMTAVLYFEILRSEHTINRLISVAGTGSGSVGSTAGASTIEATKNVETIIAKTKWMVESSGVKRAEDVILIIERRVVEIGVIDSASLESHLRKCTEAERTRDLKKFVSIVSEDVFELMV